MVKEKLKDDVRWVRDHAMLCICKIIHVLYYDEELFGHFRFMVEDTGDLGIMAVKCFPALCMNFEGDPEVLF